MTQINNNTTRRKGTHLTFKERSQIEILKRENYSNNRIAKIIGCHHQTIKNEIDKGTVTVIKQRQKHGDKVYEYRESVYSAIAGQTIYERNREHCGRRPKWVNSDQFINWADQQMLDEKKCPDPIIRDAFKNNEIDNSLIPCTTTLYHWIDQGIMKTKPMDLPIKASRKPNKKTKCRVNKTHLGISIDERPKEIDTRKHFGHWEIDTVIGKQKTEPVLLTLVERQTRFEVIIKIKDKTKEAVNHAMEGLKERLGDQYSQLFQSITSDNGTEFAGLDEALQGSSKVYFCHPYSSWERGTSENQHKLIRRFLPKGESITNVTDKQVTRIAHWMNNYSRKLLEYETPETLFRKAIRQLQIGIGI